MAKKTLWITLMFLNYFLKILKNYQLQTLAQRDIEEEKDENQYQSNTQHKVVGGEIVLYRSKEITN